MLNAVSSVPLAGDGYHPGSGHGATTTPRDGIGVARRCGAWTFRRKTLGRRAALMRCRYSDAVVALGYVGAVT